MTASGQNPTTTGSHISRIQVTPKKDLAPTDFRHLYPINANTLCIWPTRLAAGLELEILWYQSTDTLAPELFLAVEKQTASEKNDWFPRTLSRFGDAS
jgi:hypothetical protein